MKNFHYIYLVMSALLVFVLASCGPTPTPGTGTPQISIVRDGTRILTSVDPVRFNRLVDFQGTAPSSSVIKIYRKGTLFDQTSAAPTGEFNWSWNSATTEGTFVFGFSAIAGCRKAPQRNSQL